VFYALLLHRDPSRSRFTAGLDPAEAKWLQRIAENAVRRTYGSDDPARPDGAAG
jgi:hypothetical protein